jgi:hypothetical protein
LNNHCETLCGKQTYHFSLPHPLKQGGLGTYPNGYNPDNEAGLLG